MIFALFQKIVVNYRNKLNVKVLSKFKLWSILLLSSFLKSSIKAFSDNRDQIPKPFKTEVTITLLRLGSSFPWQNFEYRELAKEILQNSFAFLPKIFKTLSCLLLWKNKKQLICLTWHLNYTSWPTFSSNNIFNTFLVSVTNVS